MTVLALPVVVLALAFGAAWVTGAAWFPIWARLCSRWPGAARSAVVAAMVPVLIAAAMVLAALVPADPHIDQVFGCHCGSSMPLWLHLCPVHPAGASALVPGAALILALVLPGRLLRWRELFAEPLGQGAGGPVVTDLPMPTALLMGWLRPSLVADRRFWRALAPAERQAVIAHESAHLARRDPQLTMLLRALTSLAPRWASRHLLKTWLHRAECRADAIAVAELQSPLALAQALVRCARMGGGNATQLGCGGGHLEARIHALLDETPATARRSPDLGAPDLFILATLMVGGLLLTPWLHHHVEHLLNLSL